MDDKPDNVAPKICTKDKQSRFTWCSESMAELLSLESPSQIIGKTDADLIWHRQAPIYWAGDAEVLKGQHVSGLIEPQDQPDGLVKIIVSKSPVYNKCGEISGVMCFYTEMDKDYELASQFKCHKNGKLSLGAFYGHSTLSIREHQVLKLILHGLKPRGIQQQLNIQKGTYDTLVYRIKQKMGCQTVGDIVYSAIKSGLTHVMF